MYDFLMGQAFFCWAPPLFFFSGGHWEKRGPEQGGSLVVLR